MSAVKRRRELDYLCIPSLKFAVYEWMVQNVPYFRDKGDSNSSAGWKVRIFFFFFSFISCFYEK